MPIPHFELKRSLDDQFMFNLIAANGEIILTSERYTTKAKAQTGIESVRVNAGEETRFERRLATNGSPFFVLRAANHEVVGTSELYSSSQARDQGIKAVKDVAPQANIVDRS